MSAKFPILRLRRLRRTEPLRRLIQETQLTLNDLVYPLFIKYGQNRKDPIQSMPGIFQLSPDTLSTEIQEIKALGIQSVILFGIPAHKDLNASASFDPNGIIHQSIGIIKEMAPELLVIADLCCCEYTAHGHCGILKTDEAGNQDLCNDKTLTLLARQAQSLAQAGADILAPSGMIDGQVLTIREALDSAGFSHLPILSYSVKYASSLYGPFREAAEGAPQFGDRKTYQMDPANAKEALREATLDVLEGTDMLMVKPGNAYLDIIYQIKQKFPEIPLCAYQVSGEYSMIKAAAANGWINGTQVALESLMGLRRAGADFIISYFAKEVAPLLTP
jgi:porphobilinogen synthase